MKYLLILSVALLLASCSTNEYEVEDQLYACLEKKAEKDGLNLDKEVDKLEKFFIQGGQLKTASGKEKLAYYKKVIQQGQFSLPHGSYDTYNKVRKVFFQWPECKKGIDEKEFKKSKMYQLQKAFEKNLVNGGQVSPVQGAQAVIDVLDAEDLEHPYFRVMTLVLLGGLLEKDTSYIRKIPRKLKNVPPPPKIESWEITEIALNDKNILTFNKEEINPDEIKPRLVPILKKYEEGDRQHIRIKMTRKTEYKLFAKIYGSIQQAYEEVLNHFSEIEHKKSYLELDEAQQEALKKKHPNRVIEVKPE